MIKNHSIFRFCLAFFVFSVILVALPASSALAFTAGPNNAGLGEDVPDTGTSAWENPNNITAPIGGDLATVVLKKDFRISHYLRGTNYGFDLPPDATILGIEVAINRQSSDNNPSVVDNIVTLVTADGIIGENKAYTTTWTTTMTVAIYGGPTDLWGTTTLTPAIINSTGFGVELSAERQNKGNSDRSALVDYMQISVHYSSGGTTVVDCGAGTPEAIYGSSITCVATVTGTAGVTPTGTVAWTTGGSGTFSPTSCTLTGSGEVATCQVGYTPTDVGTGTHLITATYGGDASYGNSNGSQDVSVAPRPASVAPNATIKTYGDPDPTLTGTLTGFLAGDNVTATYNREAGETVLGGPYLITATLSPTDVLANYTVTYYTASFTITSKEASVTPNATSKTYGSPDPTLTGALAGFVAGDNVTATYSRVPGETVAGSPYVISAVLSPTQVLSNYDVTYNTANFTITKATPACVITPYNVIYDRNPHTASGACTGVAAEILAGLDLSGTTHTAVGLYTADPWTFTDVTGNYNNASGTVSDAINERPITVTADAQTKRVGEPDPAFTYQMTSGSLLSGDAFTGQLARTPGEAAGLYPILQGTLALPAYYHITYVGANLTITSGFIWLPVIIK